MDARICIHFFLYICFMRFEKQGKTIVDKEIKSLKKILKDYVIDIYYTGEYYVDYDLRDSRLKIKAIRKYNYKRWYGSSVFFEVDVDVDIKETPYYNNNEHRNKHKKRFNNWYRSSIERILKDELKFIGLSLDDEVQVSKINYVKF